MIQPNSDEVLEHSIVLGLTIVPNLNVIVCWCKKKHKFLAKLILLLRRCLLTNGHFSYCIFDTDPLVYVELVNILELQYQLRPLDPTSSSTLSGVNLCQIKLQHHYMRDHASCLCGVGHFFSRCDD